MDTDGDDTTNSDGDSSIYIAGFDSDDDDVGQFKVVICNRDDSATFSVLRNEFQNIPSYMNTLTISGMKENTNPLCNQLLSFFQDDGRIWNRIELHGHVQDDPFVFSRMLQLSMTKSKELQLWNIYHDYCFLPLADESFLDAVTVQELNIRCGSPVSSQMASGLAQGIAISRTLETVEIHGDFATHGCSAILAGGFRRNQSLTSVTFIWATIEEGGMERVYRSFIGNTRIRTLEFRSEEIMASTEAQALGALLSTPTCKMESLTLYQEENPPEIFQQFLRSLSASLVQPSSALHSLELNRCGFDDSAGTALANILEKLPSLRTLILRDNRLRDISNLGAHLPSKLIKLDLTRNCVSDFSALHHLEEIEILDLSGNNIEEHDFGKLSTVLCRFQKLKWLELRDTPISSSADDLEKFVYNIYSLPSLEKLELWSEDTSHDVVIRTLPKIAHLLCINRAGRRLLFQPQDNSIPKGLWPVVLERASRISYELHAWTQLIVLTAFRGNLPQEYSYFAHTFRNFGGPNRPSNDSMSANAVYHLLRESDFLLGT